MLQGSAVVDPLEQEKPETPVTKKAVWTVFYLLSSSLMLFVNKLVLVHFPYPQAALLLQLATSVLMLLVKRDASMSLFDAEKARKWIPVVVAWGLPLLTNMQCLAYVNVETVIIFRALATLFVALADFIFLKESFSLGALSGLLMIVCGSVMYGYNDVFFTPLGYFWGAAYAFATVFNAVFTKHMFNQSTDLTNTEKTYYNNLLGCIPVIALCFLTEDVSSYANAVTSASPVCWLALVASCFLGTAISFTGTVLRDLVSATSFNVAGNANKFLTVAISTVVFKTFNTANAFLGLGVALLGAGLYALQSMKKK